MPACGGGIGAWRGSAWLPWTVAGNGEDDSQMGKTEVSLLAELEAGLCDDRTSTTSLLQKCILLGGKVGSERLRDWARQELRGYPDRDAVPEYRRVAAPLCIDGATFGGYITGQQISSMSLPEFAREHVTEDLTLTAPLGELEDLSRRPDDSFHLQPPGAQELIVLWNHERGTGDRITRLYWSVSRSTITGVIAGVRTALAELVAEMRAATPDEHQPPTKQAVDDAMHFVLTGNRNTVTVVGSQTAANGPATITVTGSAAEPTAESDTWWQRWRKRGLIIGLATVVAAVAAVLQLFGWVPWK
jgi:AbiTii-like protein